jgi:hypothetical protein
MTQMQRANTVQVFGQDLKEAISDVKKSEYRRMLETVRERVVTSVCERVRSWAATLPRA